MIDQISAPIAIPLKSGAASDLEDDLDISPTSYVTVISSLTQHKKTLLLLPPMTKTKALVLAIGDSITQQGFSTAHSGWVASLADYYNRFGDVVNRGFSGYNSRWILEGFDDLIKHDYGDSGNILSHRGVGADKYLVTLFLGANDASEDIGAGGKVGQGVEVDEYEKNINGILDKLGDAINGEMPAERSGAPPPCRIVLITPGPCDHTKWPTRSDARVSKYAAAIRSIGAARDLPVVDLWSSEDGVPALDLGDLEDGLHFNAGGNTKLFQKLQLVLKEHFPHLVPEDDAKGLPMMEMQGPHWSIFANKDM
jgi:lysophospholipase L1-like esterase